MTIFVSMAISIYKNNGLGGVSPFPGSTFPTGYQAISSAEVAKIITNRISRVLPYYVGVCLCL